MTNITGTITEHTIRKVTGFDLNTIWQLSFGYKGLPFPAQFASGIPGIDGIKPAIDKRNQASRRTGVPFYHVNGLGRTSFMPIWLNDYLLPITRIGISRRNIIVSTPMTGKSGTVKESISASDYMITIQGLAFSAERLYPEEDVAMINELCGQRKALMMRNAITDIFMEDGYVVVEDFSFPPTRSEHTQPYEIKLLSDEVFDLNID